MDTLGSGTYGIVQLTENGTVIKKISTYYIFLRELLIIKYLSIHNKNDYYTPSIIGYNMNIPYIEMNRYQITLLEFIESRPAIGERVTVIQSLIKSIVYLHTRGIVHADLKPTNLMIYKDRVIIIDYGLSGPPGKNYVQYTTPLYKDPSKCTSYPSDIYSLGIVLAELMVGEALAKFRNVKELVDGVDTGFKPLIKKMISKDYSKRPTILKIAKKFSVKVPGTRIEIALTPREMVAIECVIDWIETVSKQFKLEYSSKKIAELAYSICTECELYQYYVLAIILIIASLRLCQFRLTTVVGLCPLGKSYLERKEILSKTLELLMGNESFITYTLQVD